MCIRDRLGVLVITLIGNGLVLLGINSFFQQVVRGVIIVVAVLANILLTQRSSCLLYTSRCV